MASLALFLSLNVFDSECDAKLEGDPDSGSPGSIGINGRGEHKRRYY